MNEKTIQGRDKEKGKGREGQMEREGRGSGREMGGKV